MFSEKVVSRSSLSVEREREPLQANFNLEVQMHEAEVVHELEGVQHLLQNFDGFKFRKRVSIDTSE